METLEHSCLFRRSVQ